MNTSSQDVLFPYLERFPEAGGPAERVPLLKVPFTIGRSETADHTIYSSKVSKEHAVIVRSGDRYAVRDLDSTNGIFINGQRATNQVLEDGDILHVAHVEFCFRHPAAPEHSAKPHSDEAVERTQMLHAEQPDSLIRGTELLREMIRTEAVEIAYQPIVDLRTRTVVAYEALARGAHPELSRSPGVLLALAGAMRSRHRAEPDVRPACRLLVRPIAARHEDLRQHAC